MIQYLQKKLQKRYKLKIKIKKENRKIKKKIYIVLKVYKYTRFKTKYIIDIFSNIKISYYL